MALRIPFASPTALPVSESEGKRSSAGTNEAVPKRADSTFTLRFHPTWIQGNPRPPEVRVLPIPLDSKVDITNGEISGMDWYGDHLVLAPQFPERFCGQRKGALLAITKSDILDYIEGRSSGPLPMKSVPFNVEKVPGTGKELRGWGKTDFW